MSKSCFYNMDVNLLFGLMVKMDSVIYILSFDEKISFVKKSTWCCFKDTLCKI